MCPAQMINIIVSRVRRVSRSVNCDSVTCGETAAAAARRHARVPDKRKIKFRFFVDVIYR